MDNTYKKIFLFALAILALFVFYQIFNSLRSSESVDEGFSVLPGENARASIGKRSLVLNVADSVEERRKGLSGLSSLPKGRGLLFIYENPGKHGIWMKDMNFPIDILWVSDDMKVVYLENNISPETYPKVFQPKEDALYVIESNAGFLKDAGVSVGDRIVIEGI